MSTTATRRKKPDGSGRPKSKPKSQRRTETKPPPEPGGWPAAGKERRDVLRAPRAFPAAVAIWRRNLVRQLVEGSTRYPGVHDFSDKPAAREALDAGLARLREIDRTLAVVHGTPRLGNKDDPVDELVYIILSRKTRESAYQSTFDALKRRFEDWDSLLRARRRTVERLVEGGGLVRRKTDSLFGALSALRDRFGSVTLEPVHSWPDEEVATFLCSLPEVQKKSAFCVMLYALERDVFPVDTHVGRCLARLSPYRELGLSLDGLDHKQLQRVLEHLVPPGLRYSLHVNLVAHGRSTCRSARPDCETCAVAAFCAQARRRRETRVTVDEPPTFVDLFCGAGGLSTGLVDAGFRPLLALDSNAQAVQTYRLNHPELPGDRCLAADITTLTDRELRTLAGRRRPDLLAGGPPCQGFSQVGNRTGARVKSTKQYRLRDDERNFLFHRMVHVARVLKPRLLLMENVPGMNSARHMDTTFLEQAARMFEEDAGLSTTIWRLEAAAFGVPQDRVRYFIVGAADGRLPQPPVPEYEQRDASGFDEDALPRVTVEEALLGLPARASDSASGPCVLEQDEGQDRRYRRYLSKFDLLAETPVVYNHGVRYHNESDLELYDLLRPGEDSVDAVERHGRDDLMRYRKDAFDDKYYRLRPDRPSKTIVAHLAKDGNGFIHPFEARSISVREGARLQSFRDDYIFCGASVEQWQQLGNAVPPLLARRVGEVLLPLLKSRRR